MWFACLVSVTCPTALALDVTVQKFKESPGLYYDHVGEARLYSMEWKIVTYINLEVVDDNFETVKNYAQMSAEFCKKHEHKFWANYTGCLNNIRQTDRPIREVNELKLKLRQLTRNKDDLVHSREKRGLFNFIGGISKILFGVMDSEDANYYTNKISIWKMSN